MIKNLSTFFVGIALSCLAGCTPIPKETTATKEYAPLEVPVPERPAGQQDVIELTTPKLDTVRVGFIGLGMRGPSAVERWTHIPGTKIVALCDLLPENTEMGIYAMEHGKHAAIEVPAAMSLDEIWALINTSEKTRKHCMQLENCVYDFFELTTLNMAQKGLFGEVLHVEGSYIHNLEEFWPYYWYNWRLDYNREFRGDVYATHGLGPACQLLNIHRGDRMKTLVAMDTKAVTGPELVKQYQKEEAPDFQNGDHTMTFIRTENGKTIHIQHDVMNPRPYSRMYQLTGTKGFANKYPIEQYCFRPDQIDSTSIPDHENLSMHSAVPEKVKEALMSQYKHPIHQELEETAKKIGGHGGMDFIMDYRLVYCLRNGLPLDMDVYDLAEWCCMAELTRLSIENGNAPVAVPDFTRGNWNKVDGYHHAFAQ